MRPPILVARQLEHELRKYSHNKDAGENQVEQNLTSDSVQQAKIILH